MSNKPTIHYVITHITLKNFVLKDSDNFMKVLMGGPDNLKCFLSAMWNDIKSRNTELRNSQDKIYESSFNVSIGVIDDNTKILTIVMPEVKEAPEATMVGVILGENLRYFTLEYDKSKIDGSNIYILCEWEKNGNHLNYGSIKENTSDSFLESIARIIN